MESLLEQQKKTNKDTINIEHRQKARLDRYDECNSALPLREIYDDKDGMTSGDDTNNMVDFSDEEGYGKFLDLREIEQVSILCFVASLSSYNVANKIANY